MPGFGLSPSHAHANIYIFIYMQVGEKFLRKSFEITILESETSRMRALFTRCLFMPVYVDV